MAGMVNAAFWRGRRVFLTGHTGFKGSWMALILHQLDASVTGYALDPPSQPSLFDLVHAANVLDDHRGDVRDRDALRSCLVAAEPEIVFHMAAQPLVRASYADPVGTYATNVMGTVHLLDAVRHCSTVRACVVVTTDKCYENREWTWGYREIDRLGGYDPYSNSKAAAELVTQSFRDSFFPPARHADHRVAVATVRAGNVIGGGDWAEDRLIPDAIRAFGAGRSLEIRYPGAIRPWQHVMDPLAGYLMLGERLVQSGPAYGEAWNFGPDSNSERTVAELLTGLTARLAAGAAWHQSIREHPHEATFLKLDCSKARTRLGWQPRIPFDTALDLTAAWYDQFRCDGDLRAVTDAQISNFVSADA